ncbi:MAG: lytic transglycosylase domain-containing protein [Desulfobulbaceae bacterium]|jgi:soluble lytic murein transglycosylase-like protein|nr:lytic transglycosylase domain-containing protein [Desulfobulbaceae bacterium]
MRCDGTPLAVLALVVLLASWVSAAPAWADMYQCRDRKGGKYFSNAPSDRTCRSVSLGSARMTASASFRYGDRYDRYDRFDRFIGPDTNTFDRSINWAAGRYGLDPLLIKAIILTESAFNARAVSRRGAQGLMQLMPDTARELRVRNPFDPHENIAGGSRYLRSLLDTFDENLTLSLAAYNAGPGAVLRAGGVPNYQETRQYVVKVLKKWRLLRQNERG